MLFIRGKAISGAPSISGTSQFPVLVCYLHQKTVQSVFKN